MVDFDIRPLAHALGAEVVGLDVSRPIDDDTQRRLREAWLEHLVLVFREQSLTSADLIEFSRRWADLDPHDGVAANVLDPEHPEVMILRSQPTVGNARRSTEYWHSDMSFTTRPAVASVLYARAVPPVGGDTCWANMYLAYDQLSPVLQRFLDGLEAVHDVNHDDPIGNRPLEQYAARQRLYPAVRQPVVLTHPETGRKALYLGERNCPQFVGMTRDESRPILEMLFRHCGQAHLQFRHRWMPNDVVIWDNRCTVHRAVGDFDAGLHQRELLRTSLVGEPRGHVLTRSEYAVALGD